MTTKFLVSMFALRAGCLCQLAEVPFACNLKAFTSGQRAHHRELTERLTKAVVTARERNDGYALRVDTNQFSVSRAAEWVDLERKCCPFFDFELDLHGENGELWMVLKGRKGVKQFIEIEFTRLRDQLESAKKVSRR